MTRAGTRLRTLVPPILVRALPRGRRLRHVEACLSARDDRRLVAVLGGERDDGVIWRVVCALIEAGRLGPLVPLAEATAGQDPFARALLGAMAEGGEALAALGHDPGHGPFERMCARAWALYLSLPRFSCAPAGPMPRLCQFWDTPDPPPEIAAAIAAWQALTGARHERHDARSAEAFLRREAGPAEAALFRNAGHPAIQTDYFRLGWLAARGGVAPGRFARE